MAPMKNVLACAVVIVMTTIFGHYHCYPDEWYAGTVTNLLNGRTLTVSGCAFLRVCSFSRMPANGNADVQSSIWSILCRRMHDVVCVDIRGASLCPVSQAAPSRLAGRVRRRICLARRRRCEWCVDISLPASVNYAVNTTPSGLELA